MVSRGESPETRPKTDGSHQRSCSCKPLLNRQHIWAQLCAVVLLEGMKHQSLKTVYFWNALKWLIGVNNIRARGISSSSAVLWWESPSETLMNILWTFTENVSGYICNHSSLRIGNETLCPLEGAMGTPSAWPVSEAWIKTHNALDIGRWKPMT